jgi:pyruvate/2-oxoglutarate dehydrogenase complex dihydrolipoamide dehydrogenase (E3) component
VPRGRRVRVAGAGAALRTHRRGGQSERYDLIVIGGGAGGSSIAFGAAEQGLRVGLIEEWKLGGTCLNAGCDPTKTLVRSAEVLHLAKTASRFGITVDRVEADWSAVRRRVDEVIETIRDGDGPDNLRDAGIDFFETSARFISESEVLAGGRILTADRFVIATGNAMQVPPIDGLAEVGYLTNKDAVSLETLPDSLAIIGGGVVAVEFAQIFARFSVDVTIVGSGEHLLPKEETVLADALAGILEQEGIAILLSAQVRHAERGADGIISLVCSSPDGDITVQASEILLATGRRPDVHDLNLDAAGVVYSEQGVQVDSTLVTSVPHIWAVGDVTGIYPFTHVADYQARIALHNLLGEGTLKRADYRVVPWATFTDPELARVGLTEAEAKAGGYSVATVITSFEDLPRAITADARDGLVKLVVDRATHQVLGGHILGAGAGELIGEIALVMRHRLPVSAISDTIHVYPTMSEGVFWAAWEIATEALEGTTPVSVR